MSLPSELLPVGLLGTGAAAEGYTISRSLRFNSADSAYLSRTPASAGNRKTWTWAGWVKRSAIANQRLFTAGANGTYDSMFQFVGTNNSQFEVWNYQNGTKARKRTLGLFRDFSAWYHIVVRCTSSTLKIYVNGTEADYETGADNVDPDGSDWSFNAVVSHTLGKTAWGTEYFDGYLADVHFIDGQALDPTSFGEFDTNGIWQPIEYTGEYGTNGFRLPFSDNSTAAALGTDTSGNGNDWTVNNIAVTTPTGRYIPSVSGTPYSVNYGIANMFNGGTTDTFGYIAAASGTTTWTFPTPLSFTSLRVFLFVASGSSTITFNWSGGSYNLVATNATANYNWVDVSGSVTSPVTSITWATNGASGPYVYAWEVDGVILTDAIFGSNNDSLVDVPTNGTETDTGVGGEVRGNYCTLNPLATQSGGSATLSEGNLKFTLGATRTSVFGTYALIGKTYWEAVFTGGAYIVGMAEASEFNTTADTSPNRFIGDSSDGWSIGNDGTVYNGGSTGSETSWTNGDVIGWSYDSSNGSIKIYKNGTLNGSYTADATKTFFPAATLFTTSSYIDFNFGQRPFAYTAPSGFKALCTANLDAPVITKPSEYMDIALYTGNGSTQTISGLEFSPDLVWIKERSNTRFHALCDSVRGDGLLLYSNSTLGEQDIGSTVVQLTTDGFNLGFNSGYTAVSHNWNGVTHAAWAWDAGSSTVTNTDGSITSQVRANASAGFSIVSYTGNGTNNATVGHGLGVTPSFVIVKSRDGAQEWIVYHSDLTPNNNLLLNLTNAEGSWNEGYITLPTSTTFRLTGGPNLDNINTNTHRHVAYCFAPVEGYSAFGSYVGGANNGPFVYTGFRPRWIMVKSIESDALQDYLSWVIYDTARQPYNTGGPVRLYANRAYQEGLRGNGNTDTFSETFDILSNGFKLGGNYDIETNQPGDTYIYAAFAESPFALNARAR